MTSNEEMFRWSLLQACKSKLVNKIIVVDNTDDGSFNIVVDKLHVIRNYENRYVNPAWNQAIEQCTSDMYVICNDDILVSSNVYDIVDKALQDDKIGLVTFNTTLHGDISTYEQQISNINYKDSTYSTNVPDGRQGWIMGGRVCDWIKIPDNIVIWFGDDFIYNTIRYRGLMTIISNYPVLHHQSTTLNNHSHKRHFDNIIRNDKHHWNSIKLNLSKYINNAGN